MPVGSRIINKHQGRIKDIQQEYNDLTDNGNFPAKRNGFFNQADGAAVTAVALQPALLLQGVQQGGYRSMADADLGGCLPETWRIAAVGKFFLEIGEEFFLFLGQRCRVHGHILQKYKKSIKCKDIVIGNGLFCQAVHRKKSAEKRLDCCTGAQRYVAGKIALESLNEPRSGLVVNVGKVEGGIRPQHGGSSC